jgi:asparagine synthase (glutamine-hydrolysing)
LLRRTVAPLLPREIIRGRKQGFSIPVAAWLRGDLAPFARDVLSNETVERQGLLRPEAVTRVLDDHISGREDLSRQIWGLLSFTLWFDRYTREPAGAEAAAGDSRSPRTRSGAGGALM